ncbi:MAG: zinc ribbon domain-containing protein [Candidatus Brocadiia bacterium]
MRKMWKLYAALVLGAMLFSAGCGKSDNPPVTDNKAEPAKAVTETATAAPAPASAPALAGMEQPTGPVCQSCAMPMARPEDFGTNTDKTPCQDYCNLCYQNGAFMGPDMTCDQMIDLCTGVLCKKMNMPEPQARDMMKNCIPKLKRWQKTVEPKPAEAPK